MTAAVIQMPASSPMLLGALESAHKEFKVFPVYAVDASGVCQCGHAACKSPGKHPVRKGWQETATADLDRVNEWFGGGSAGYSYGIATGKPSGIVVVDVDPAKGGNESLEQLKPLPVTLTHITGGGGLHLLFRHPGVAVSNKVGLLPGIDIRGDGGYIVGPGCRHKSGGRYSVQPGCGELAEFPDHIHRRISEANAKREPFTLPDDIPSGSRNDTMFRFACALRAHGLTPVEIFDALRGANRRCKPPLDEGEMNQIAESAGRYAARFPLTEDGLARRFVHAFGQDFRYAGGTWWHWTGQLWRPDDAEAVEVVRELVRTVREEVSDKDDVKRAMSLQTNSRITGIRKLAASDRAIKFDPAMFDNDPMLFQVANGVVDLKSGALRAPRREDFVTKSSPVTFDEGARAPRFLDFLQETFQGDNEMIRYVQRAFGYALTGETKEQVFFLLHGGGGNGKGTLVETLKVLYGGYGLSLAPSVLIARKDVSVPNDVAAIVGARFAIASESERNQKFAVEQLKRLTGEDTIAARMLYKEHFNFKPAAKIFFATNEVPSFDGADYAFYRRLHVWEFKQTIPSERKDPQLRAKLAAEQPGIFNWMLEGCLEWQRIGLKPPRSVLERVSAYCLEMDRTAQFLEEECELGPDLREPASALYNYYRVWCLRNDSQPLSAQYFARDLAKKGVHKVKSNGNKVYVGVRHKESQRRA